MQQCGRRTGERQSSVSRRRRCPRWPAWPSPRTTSAAWRQRCGLAVPGEYCRRGVFSATSAPRTELNWSAIVVSAGLRAPRGRETLGGATRAETWTAVSRPFWGPIRRAYVPTALVTRPLCSGTVQPPFCVRAAILMPAGHGARLGRARRQRRQVLRWRRRRRIGPADSARVPQHPAQENGPHHQRTAPRGLLATLEPRWLCCSPG